MRLLLALCLSLLPQTGAALTCIEPDVRYAYRYLDGLEEEYIMVLGRLVGAEQLVADNRDKVARALARAEATEDWSDIPDRRITLRQRFVGHTPKGLRFAQPFEAEITITATCTPLIGAGDCTHDYTPLTAEQVAHRDPMLTFLRKEGGAYSLSLDECGGFTFPAPSPRTRRRALSCAHGGC